ncbi:dynein light chain Tctex-type 5-B-like [Antedon mediterranea]|uniref:dynein light chain Tctex-type 5-B-like n=1 Tax=Antedon mediterranea TaxID=105859 RepID=UPI003AF721A1
MSEKHSSDLARDKAARLLKKRGSASSLMSSSEYGGRYRPAGSMSTVSFMDDPNEITRVGHNMKLEPTYQLNPTIKFPVKQIKDILQDALEGYLGEEKYEPELCKQMTKTISEVVKARVKDLRLKRYKIIVVIHIGQLNDQGMRVSSRCLWDDSNDNFSSHQFANNSLFAVAMVYGVYYE